MYMMKVHNAVCPLRLLHYEGACVVFLVPYIMKVPECSVSFVFYITKVHNVVFFVLYFMKCLCCLSFLSSTL